MAKNVAHQIVSILEGAGIRRIYAVTGDSLNHLNIAVRNSERVDWIHVRHEEAGAYAAAAEAELEGFACCAGSSGPGHVHLINGAYEANRSHLPMLIIASTIGTSEMGLGYFQATDTMKLFEDCSVYNQLITRPEQVERVVHTAIQHAFAKKGVAVVGLPGDISEMDAVSTGKALNAFRTRPVVRPADTELQVLADLVNAHKKITVFCGIGAAGARRQVIDLARKLQAPVGYSFRGKMAIQPDNPFEVGMTGLLGQSAAYHAMHEADLLLLLGTDFPYEAFMPTKNAIVQIDEAPERLGRRARLAMGLCGDVKDTLEALLPLLHEKADAGFLDKQLKRYGKVKEENRIYIDDNGSEGNIQPEYLTHVIDGATSADAIFTVDTGMVCVWGARFINGTGERKMLGSFNHGSMANAMPMAIGASLVYPERQVIALCGDGGLSMLLGDLATIQQYKLPITIVVYNNRSLGMVKLEMLVEGMEDNETDMLNPDFALVAQAMGFPGENIHRPEDVPMAVQRAVAHRGPYLLNVFTNPNALAMPPKVELDQVMGMAKSMGKLMLSGKIGEVLDTVKSNIKHLSR